MLIGIEANCHNIQSVLVNEERAFLKKPKMSLPNLLLDVWAWLGLLDVVPVEENGAVVNVIIGGIVVLTGAVVLTGFAVVFSTSNMF